MAISVCRSLSGLVNKMLNIFMGKCTKRNDFSFFFFSWKNRQFSIFSFKLEHKHKCTLKREGKKIEMNSNKNRDLWENRRMKKKHNIASRYAWILFARALKLTFKCVFFISKLGSIYGFFLALFSSLSPHFITLTSTRSFLILTEIRLFF
jgi:hypothetical protein